MLDTFIGENDGVPFTIPGVERLCDTQHEFEVSDAVPDFIQALEREDLVDPGTIARVQFRLGHGLEAPNRVTLGAWPDGRLSSADPRCRDSKTMWEVPVLPMKLLRDSAVTIYWDEKELPPGGKRYVGFSYGLGNVSGGEGGGQLALTIGGSFTPGGVFSVTAYVKNPAPGQTVTLSLPEGFRLIEGREQQQVPALSANAASRNSPVTWKVRSSSAEGKYVLRVQSSTGKSQSQPVVIRGYRIFD